jgi:glutathione S-transferase
MRRLRQREDDRHARTLSSRAPAVRERRKWQLEKGLDDPEAQAALRIYDGFLADMEAQLSQATWLAGPSFSLAEVGVVPYVNRLDMLQLSGMWTESRQHLADWWQRIKARPSFAPALMKYVPPALVTLMEMHGSEAWPQVRAILREKA